MREIVDDIRFIVTNQTDLQARQIILQGQRYPLVGDQQDQELLLIWTNRCIYLIPSLTTGIVIRAVPVDQ